MTGSTRKLPLAVLAVLACATVAFILVHGMQPSAGSWEESDVVAAALGPVLQRLYDLCSGLFSLTGHAMPVAYGVFVRKLAHFVEYALLGAECAGLTAVMLRRVVSPYLWADLFIVLMVAVTDEFAQSFVGRTSSVGDVLIDFSGALAGITIALAVAALAYRPTS